MKKKFKELKSKLSPEAQARVRSRVREEMAGMLLGEIRRLVGLTQEELAGRLGIKQPTLSRLESQDDMQISTLQKLIQALGGTMEIVVHLPSGDIRIEQLKKST